MFIGIKYVVGGVITASVFAAGVTVATGGVQWVTAPFRGEVAANEQTVGDGAYRNSTYEHFFNLCSSVMTKEDQIANLETELENATESRAAQIHESITALRNSRAEAINDYNADSAKETREFMKDNNLPDRLSVEAENTECAL